MQSIAGYLGSINADTTAFVAPPGYLDAVRYNLALRLSIEWNKPLKPLVAAMAIESLAIIQRLNDITPQMTCNPGVLPPRSGISGWSRLSGDFLGEY
jgi:hypothetical protein